MAAPAPDLDLSESAVELSEVSMADSLSMMMQNATASQKSMQTMTNTAVAVGCNLIIARGGESGP